MSIKFMMCTVYGMVCVLITVCLQIAGACVYTLT